MARIHSLLEGQFDNHNSAQTRQENRAELVDHLYDISDDPSASDPSLYFSRANTKTLEWFVEMADELDWPNAAPIDMRAHRIEDVPVWTSIPNMAKTVVGKAVLYPKISDTQPGYPYFARLNTTPTQQLAICRDGIRSLRGSGGELTKSKGMGWGRLPNPRYLLDAIEPVKVLVNYSPYKTLEEALLRMIDPGELRRYRF